MRGRIWLEYEVDYLRKNYADMSSKGISENLGISVCSVHNKAYQLGLKKSKAFLQQQGKRVEIYGKKYQFKKGNISFNKGKKQIEYMSAEAIARTVKTRFKKGIVPHSAKAEGHERIDREGYIYIKPKQGKHILKHVWLWEKTHGKVPDKHVVIFKDGDKKNITLENLECITMAENMRRNTLHQYPAELQQAIKTKNKLVKLISKQNKK